MIVDFLKVGNLIIKCWNLKWLSTTVSLDLINTKVLISKVVFLFWMNLWSVEHFLAVFVITFGWVQQQSNSKPTQKWWQIWTRYVQLITGSFRKEILLIKWGLYLRIFNVFLNFYAHWLIFLIFQIWGATSRRYSATLLTKSKCACSQPPCPRRFALFARNSCKM